MHLGGAWWSMLEQRGRCRRCTRHVGFFYWITRVIKRKTLRKPITTVQTRQLIYIYIYKTRHKELMLFYWSLAFDNPIAVITHTLAGHVFTVQNPERFTFTHSTRERYKRNKVTRGPLSQTWSIDRLIKLALKAKEISSVNN